MDVENGMFKSEIGSGFGEPGGTPLPKIPRSAPRGNNSQIGILSTSQNL